jgi:hypothetical protein
LCLVLDINRDCLVLWDKKAVEIIFLPIFSA